MTFGVLILAWHFLICFRGGGLSVAIVMSKLENLFSQRLLSCYSYCNIDLK